LGNTKVWVVNAVVAEDSAYCFIKIQRKEEGSDIYLERIKWNSLCEFVISCRNYVNYLITKFYFFIMFFWHDPKEPKALAPDRLAYN